MNDRRLLIAAEFHFVHPVKKRQKKKTKKQIKTNKKKTSWHKTLSSSAVKVNKIQDAA